MRAIPHVRQERRRCDFQRHDRLLHQDRLNNRWDVKLCCCTAAATDGFFLPINGKLLLWLCQTNGLLAARLQSCCQRVYIHDNASEQIYSNELLSLCVAPLISQIGWRSTCSNSQLIAVCFVQADDLEPWALLLWPLCMSFLCIVPLCWVIMSSFFLAFELQKVILWYKHRLVA